jgi:hypothetical protein
MSGGRTAAMPRRLVITLIGSLTLACTRPGDSKSEREAPEVAKEPDRSPVEPKPLERPWIEPARTHLLVRGHLHEQPEVRVLPISLVEAPASSSSTNTSTRASGPSVGSQQTLAAAPAPNWPGHFVSELAHGGSTRFVTVQGGPETWQLEVRDVDAPSSVVAQVEIGGVVPSALMMVGDSVFLGQADTVAWIDLAATPPVRSELHRRPDMVGKAYDLFVRSGSWLFAIDDQVGPIWADGFRLGGGKPERINDFTMPSAINGMYYAGELVASGPDQGVLYLLLHYGIMDGHGHDLTALTIREGKLQVDPEVLINSSAGIDPPVLEEHVDRGSGKPEKLAAGDAYSEWNSIVHVPPVTGGPARLLISAVERGLLEIPIEFGPTTKASVIDLGGAVVDVMLIGGRVHALVDVEQPLARSELVELTMLPSGARVERRTALPDRYQRFVR